MTKEECRTLKPGMQCMIGDDFIEDSCDEIEEYLGTIQTVERVEFDSCGWVYFEDLHQPFAMSEISHIVYEEITIDDENIPYECGSFELLFQGV